jgi:DNA-binding MarR family transcriptional regulator
MNSDISHRTLDSVVKGLFHILPVFHKQLFRVQLVTSEGNLFRLHFITMAMVDEEDNLPVCEVARRLGMRKSQMTPVLNQLVELGMVVKRRDAKDRRMSRVSLTNHGRATLEEFKGMIRQNIKGKLSHLAPEELEELSLALGTLRKISAYLEAEGKDVS